MYSDPVVKIPFLSMHECILGFSAQRKPLNYYKKIYFLNEYIIPVLCLKLHLEDKHTNSMHTFPFTMKERWLNFYFTRCKINVPITKCEQLLSFIVLSVHKFYIVHWTDDALLNVCLQDLWFCGQLLATQIIDIFYCKLVKN